MIKATTTPIATMPIGLRIRGQNSGASDRKKDHYKYFFHDDYP
jgi:hypothetical protein